MNVKTWTTKELQLLRERYSELGPRGMSRIVEHSPKSCQTKAQELQLSMSREAKARQRSERMKEIGHKPTERARRPFDDMPPEYIKVSSIWRVGQRYKLQKPAQNMEAQHEPA